MKIIATKTRTGEEEEINDLYWFEEAGVHRFDEMFSEYTFRVLIEPHEQSSATLTSAGMWIHPTSEDQ